MEFQQIPPHPNKNYVGIFNRKHLVGVEVFKYYYRPKFPLLKLGLQLFQIQV